MSFPKLQFTIGFRCDLQNSVHFLNEDTLLYPAGNMYVVHNIHNNSQKFLTDRKLNKAVYAAFDSETKLLALIIPGKRRHYVAIFDLTTMERVASLSYDQMSSKTIICFAFSPDGKHVLGQTGPPNWQMILWDWNKNEVICAYDPLNLKKECEIYQISFHPKDFSQVCAVGKRILRCYRISGGNFKQFIFQRNEEEIVAYLCHVWFAKSKIAIGTSDGKILVVENNQEIDVILVTDEYCQDPNRGGIARRQLSERILNTMKPINQLTATNKRILALWENRVVVVYETKDGTIKHIPLGIVELPLNEEDDEENEKILNLIVSPKGQLLIATTSRSRICSFSFDTEEWEKCYRATFVCFLQPNFFGGIRDFDICIQKQLIAICTPYFIHLWDYKMKQLELRQFIYQGLYSVAIHPSGNYIVAGCGDKLRYFAAFLNEFKILKEYPIRESNQCEFSEGGHLFASTSGYVICIYSSLTLDIIIKLKGHFGEVRSIKWIESDTSLLSCAQDGAFYKWDLKNGSRIQDNVDKNCSYYDIFVAKNESVFITSSNKTIKEFKNFKIIKMITCNETITCCASSICSSKVYLGTSEGNLRMETLPLPELLDGENQAAHLGKMKKMRMSYDGISLITAGEDGTLCLWQVECEVQRQSVLFPAIFTTKDDVRKLVEEINQLQQYIEELKIDKAYQIRKKDEQNDKYIKNLTNKFNEDIKVLKEKIFELNKEIIYLKEEHELEKNNLKIEQEDELRKQREEYINKLIVEYQRIEKVQNQTKLKQEAMKKVANDKLKEQEEFLQGKNNEFEGKLKKAEKELEEVKESWKKEEEAWQLYFEDMENNSAKEINQIKSEYEKQLKTRKESLLLYKTELGIMKNKVASLKSEIDHNHIHIQNQQQEINSLKEIIEERKSKENIYRNEIEFRDKSVLLKEEKILKLQNKLVDLEKRNFILNECLREEREYLEILKIEKNHIEERVKELQNLSSNNENSQQKQEKTTIIHRTDNKEKIKTVKTNSMRNKELHKDHASTERITLKKQEKEDLKQKRSEAITENLRKQLERQNKIHKKECIRLKQENMTLMDKLQQLMRKT